VHWLCSNQLQVSGQGIRLSAQHAVEELVISGRLPVTRVKGL
jgi:hypothetical protein